MDSFFGFRQQSIDLINSLVFFSRLTCYVIIIAYYRVLLRKCEHQNGSLLKQLEMYT